MINNTFTNNKIQENIHKIKFKRNTYTNKEI